MKILISKKTGIYYYYKEGSGDYHCKEGFLKAEDIISGENIIVSNNKGEFFVFDANIYDKRQKIKRGPQIINPKDLGYIAARTGMNKKTMLIEAGGGSGAATLFFSGICSKVLCYEIKEDHCKIIRKNLELFEIDNVDLINGDLSENIENISEQADIVFLDMPDPAIVLEKNLKCLKKGGFIVCYIPSIGQIMEISKLVCDDSNKYYFEEVSEVILRNWKVKGRVSRPEHKKETDHTAFLVFIRKVS